jgi:glutamate synthase (NADPH/NADH) small chain
VRCVYRRSRAEAPARAEELRHAEEEGVEMLFLHDPVEVLTTADGTVRGMVVAKMTLGEPDERGRRRPVPTGEREEIECDTVVVALGTNPNPVVTRTTPGLGLDARGYIAVDPDTQATNLPRVFAGGDIVTGGATVILAMGAGRRAAASMLELLRHGTQHAVPDVPPTTVDRCPRCRRPVDPDHAADGVCCADEVVAWRCTECAKRSEGFAFPYGRCPACGGTLEVLEGVSAIEHDVAREAVRHAFEIELGGTALYAEAAERTDDVELRHLFEQLAEMEREHLATLVRRYHLDPPEVGTAGLRDAARRSGVELPADAERVLELALDMEARAERFFRTEAATAPAAAADLYRELAAEEAEHVALLTTELAAMRAGRGSLLGSRPS